MGEFSKEAKQGIAENLDDIKELLALGDTSRKISGDAARDELEKKLGGILAEMYEKAAADKKQVAAIHIFGIKYGQMIVDNDLRIKSIVSYANLNDSYYQEVNKGVNIYSCLKDNMFEMDMDDLVMHDDIHETTRVKDGQNILYYGVPGSGKSYAISQICSEEQYMERVVFHPDYTYSDFVGQILPRVVKDKLEYVFTPGPFTRILKKAYRNPKNMYYLVIEEINRGNAPAIFGEIFQLLDRTSAGSSEYGISNYDVAKEVYKNPDQPVKIPSNLTVLATMNTSDQNVFTLDTAFQRRWKMKHIPNRFEDDHAQDMIQGTNIAWGAFAAVVNDMVIDISVDISGSGDKRLGAYFARTRELQSDVFPEKVLKYLWDDAFRMDKETLFSEKYKSLDDLIEVYEVGSGDKLQSVLRASVYKQMLDRTILLKENGADESEDEADNE